MPAEVRVVSQEKVAGEVAEEAIRLPSTASESEASDVPALTVAAATTCTTPETRAPLSGEESCGVGRASTLTSRAARCAAEGTVPIRLTVCVASPRSGAALNVRVELPPAITVAGENEPVKPAGPWKER